MLKKPVYSIDQFSLHFRHTACTFRELSICFEGLPIGNYITEEITVG